MCEGYGLYIGGGGGGVCVACVSVVCLNVVYICVGCVYGVGEVYSYTCLSS